MSEEEGPHRPMPTMEAGPSAGGTSSRQPGKSTVNLGYVEDGGSEVLARGATVGGSQSASQQGTSPVVPPLATRVYDGGGWFAGVPGRVKGIGQ